MSQAESVYIIPCPCGQEIRSHEPRATCPQCGTQLEIRDWGKPPTPEEEKAAATFFSIGKTRC